ncbi:hypothetical protein [Haloglomus salinum]|uniref:hypothetical protein n=1 Tax=Haloglomus salinum TaxID=2962673 RepID=UPI0020C99AA9|nr:hypothetical protein [Haloglomus salinum]
MDRPSLSTAQRRISAIILLITGVLALTIGYIGGDSTMVACSFEGGIFAGVYDVFGIYFPKFSLRIDIFEFSMTWYDGCNWHGTTLFWPLIGLAAIIAGAALVTKTSLSS